MEYTGIGMEKEEFVPRKNMHEFFRDGEAIEELCRLTFRVIMYYSSLKSSNVLDIFNNAYQICRSHLFQQSFVIKFRNTERKDFSYAVALVLVQLHQKFYTISEESVLSLKSKISPRVWKEFQSFAKIYELAHPIFLGQEKEFDFTQVKDHILASLEEADRLQKENKELRKQLEMEETLRGKAEQVAIEIQQKLEVWENDSFYKAVNIETILKYVQEGDCNKNDVPAIKLMLLSLCAGEVPKEVIEKIKTLKCGGNVTIYDIKKVENFNPTASKSETNHYHNKE